MKQLKSRIMKKLFMAIALCIVCALCSCQNPSQESYAKALAEVFSSECSAIIESSSVIDDRTYAVVMSVPDIYDNELIITTTNIIMRSFSDVKMRIYVAKF